MNIKHHIPILLAIAGCSPAAEKKSPSYNPNILWIVIEDISPDLSCYGETSITTPNLDKLSSEGELFENAFVTSPVCSPSRSALITGMLQNTVGIHNHRSQTADGRGAGNQPYLPSYNLSEDIPYLPKLFKEAGYYTVLGDESTIIDFNPDPDSFGKSDYNFALDDYWYDSNNWSNRKSGQPFFAQIQLRGGKFRNARVEVPVNPDEIDLPPYYPDDEVLREDWAEYLNSILFLDTEIKNIFNRLDDEGIADSTVIFVFSDHGISHLRGKQFLYDEGMRIPLIIRWPDFITANSRRKDLVTQTDISATSLYLAGIDIPENMHGKSLYGEKYVPREFIFATRDRCDETIDAIRGIRTDRFKYIRNFFPHKPHAQPNRYKDNKKIIRHMRHLYSTGSLQNETVRYFLPSRQPEELYDLKKDPYEMTNLAGNPAYFDTLVKFRDMLITSVIETADLGFIPEPISEELGKIYGNKYYILKQSDNQNLIKKCIETIVLAEKNNVTGLMQALSHDNESIRFWAAYGLGNIPELSTKAIPLLTTALEDKSDAVKIAAARALCITKKSEKALDLLINHLDNPNYLVGLYAALFIEDLDESMINKALPALIKAKDSPYEYTRRVAVRLSQ